MDANSRFIRFLKKSLDTLPPDFLKIRSPHVRLPQAGPSTPKVFRESISPGLLPSTPKAFASHFENPQGQINEKAN